VCVCMSVCLYCLLLLLFCKTMMMSVCRETVAFLKTKNGFKL